ncbi:MAG: glycosyltransferase [Timaviella obliquedivisa GSE-PSE-MK23-08B]|jgi:hypothetical protein|nr:glycosyltransferase [Timaviella obliquedivisa GSE-PSE-MK23-08B]
MTISRPPAQWSNLEPLESLPYPVYFVCKDVERWQDLIESESLPTDVSPLYERCLSVRDIWSAQSYISLKRLGLNVYLVPDYVPGKICIVPYDDLVSSDRAFNSYVVACRYDRGRPEICEQRLVINTLNVIDKTDHYVPHWPQPNLIPRHSDRGTQVENLVFKGMERNLAAPFKTLQFKEELSAIGIQFVVTADPSADPTTRLFQEWTDYTQADVVLAVRNNTQHDLTVKPALKLINAWFAGCPAILGPEPAYQAIRQSNLDFIEVRTLKETIDALQRLKNDPDLYAAMVENGFQRVKDFTANQVAWQWRQILAGSIAQDYEQWQQQSFLQKRLGRPLKFLIRRSRHNRSERYHRQNILQGARLFGEE